MDLAADARVDLEHAQHPHVRLNWVDGVSNTANGVSNTNTGVSNPPVPMTVCPTLIPV